MHHLFVHALHLGFFFQLSLSSSITGIVDLVLDVVDYRIHPGSGFVGGFIGDALSLPQSGLFFCRARNHGRDTAPDEKTENKSQSHGYLPRTLPRTLRPFLTPAMVP